MRLMNASLTDNYEMWWTGFPSKKSLRLSKKSSPHVSESEHPFQTNEACSFFVLLETFAKTKQQASPLEPV